MHVPLRSAIHAVISRHQLAVAPRISPRSLAQAALVACSSPAQALDAAAAALRSAFGADACVLTDSGTSALVMALRVLLPVGGTVALPGYGCIDLASAALFAGVKVRLYDLDPVTLSPDLTAVERALRRGVDTIVVAHYYGYPADVPAVRRLAAAYGVPVLEDAAQGAGGILADTRLGALGDLAILSFGRGKGLFGGRGGALMALTPEWSSRIEELQRRPARRGARDLASAVVQWAMGRPRLYALPAAIPWLHLGEMTYHPAHEPRSLSGAAASLACAALLGEPRDVAARREIAAALQRVAEADGVLVEPIRSIAGGLPGFLRFAVLDRSGARAAAPQLGIMRGYPLTLHEQPELYPNLVAGEPPTPGASELRASLFTLPTHGRVTGTDLRAHGAWMANPGEMRRFVSRTDNAAIARP